MQNTTFTAAVTDHADFDPIALWASLSNEWDALPDLMLDMGNVADADIPGRRRFCLLRTSMRIGTVRDSLSTWCPVIVTVP